MPHKAVVGRSPIVANQLCRVSRNVPAGLPNSVAILARNVLSPMPTVHDSPVRSATACWTSCASASGSSVTAPRNASSHPMTSTTTANDRSTVITSSDAAS